MSNRRLMSALSILLIAALFMVVGCGTGKRQKERLRVNKNSTNLKTTKNVKDTNTDGCKVAVGNAKDLKAKAASSAAIRSRIDSLMAEGKIVDRNSMVGGIYTLSSVTSFASFMVPACAEDSLAISEAQVVNVELQSPQNSHSGVISAETDSGRTIEIPVGFQVDTQTNRFVNPKTTTNKILKSQIDFSGDISLDFVSGAASFSVLDKIMSVDSQPDKSYVVTVDGRTVTLKIQEIETGLRILVAVDEAVSQATAEQGEMTLSRMIALTYTVDPASKKLPAVTTNPYPSPAAPATAPAQPTEE